MDKPLPNDPALLDATRSRPALEQTKSRRIATKSVPNLRTVKESHRFDAGAKASGNSQSSTDADKHAQLNGFVPKLQRNLGKGIPRPAQKEVVSKRPENTQANRTLKARTVSLEHLKSLCSTRRTQQQNTAPRFTDMSSRRDALKNHVLNYLSSDKVTETWETTVRNEKNNSRYSSQKKIDWPLSIFRGRSSNHPQASSERDAYLPKDGLGGEMTWLEEGSEDLNTYPLKPKLDISPRIHVISVQQTLVEGVEINPSENENTAAETESIITALPSVSLFPSEMDDDGENVSGNNPVARSHLQLTRPSS